MSVVEFVVVVVVSVEHHQEQR